MSETAFITLRGLLVFCAVVEVGTGIALMVAPELVAALLVRGQVTELATLLGRCMGIALLALGLACWPPRQAAPPGSAAFRAMLTYSTLIALFLGYIGAVAHLGGPFLWPAAGLHGAMALLLVRAGRQNRPSR